MGAVRLITTVLWSLASIIWLPWFATQVRLVIDLASGVPLLDSDYFTQAFVPVWPIHSWYVWDFFSWIPLAALLAMLLVYIGWRFFWWADDWVPSYRLPAVVATMLIPPVSLFLLKRDTRRRFQQRNASLQNAVDDALERIDDQELRLIR
jgi:small-conductance mechanosensitive channel